MHLEGASPRDFDDLAAKLEETFGRLDGLLHNAASLPYLSRLKDYDAQDWMRIMQVNLNAPFLMTQACLPLLLKAEDASVIFTSDAVGRRAKAYWGAYAVSKFATEGLSQVLADEHRHGKLRSNCINPGATRTDMRLAAYPAEDRDLLKGPDEILDPYVYLLGPDSKGVTGESIDAQ